jgi:hypothetical protein
MGLFGYKIVYRTIKDYKTFRFIIFILIYNLHLNFINFILIYSGSKIIEYNQKNI